MKKVAHIFFLENSEPLNVAFYSILFYLQMYSSIRSFCPVLQVYKNKDGMNVVELEQDDLSQARKE